MSSALFHARPGGPPCCCWVCFSAACRVLGSDLPRGSPGPGPDTRGPRQGARPPRTSGRSPGSAPAPLPLHQTFSQLPDLLRSASRSASLMNYSAVRAPISAPRPPRRARTRGGGSSPAPRAPLPPRPGAARPSPNPAQPRPARPRAAVSLPPALSPLRSHPPGRLGAHPARRASSTTPGRGGDRERPAHPQPGGAGPRGPGGTPTLATSRSAPARRSQCEDAPRPPARAAGTRGHTWTPPPGACAERARMGPR